MQQERSEAFGTLTYAFMWLSLSPTIVQVCGRCSEASKSWAVVTFLARYNPNSLGYCNSDIMLNISIFKYIWLKTPTVLNFHLCLSCYRFKVYYIVLRVQALSSTEKHNFVLFEQYCSFRYSTIIPSVLEVFLWHWAH